MLTEALNRDTGAEGPPKEKKAVCLYWTALKTQLAIYKLGDFLPVNYQRYWNRRYNISIWKTK